MGTRERDEQAEQERQEQQQQQEDERSRMQATLQQGEDESVTNPIIINR